MSRIIKDIFLYIFVFSSWNFFSEIFAIFFCISSLAHRMLFGENTIFSTHDARCLFWIDFSITLRDRGYHGRRSRHQVTTANSRVGRRWRASRSGEASERGFTLVVSGASYMSIGWWSGGLVI